ncbi:TPA: glycosyltransferase 52 family protein [Vibrio parahaemolyticus]|nr:glycosyltransferase 52 family protein [Vibrio parahaemolyticus]HCE4591776.1 glycosyltransferase 52 family protein [Vibrio parahaemolyticus]HCG5926482.1 glycosyltransferase 52 family protein [Vibrio parahaemolyticus]
MDLFVVTSPLQYVCALEAKEYFNSQNAILVLVNQKSALGLEQQHRLLNTQAWQHVITISRDNRSITVPNTIRQIRGILKGKPIQRFFYAEYNAWRTKLLIKNLPIEQEIYFDDGTLTLAEYPKFIFPKAEFFRPRWFQDFVVRLNGCKPIGRLKQSQNLEVFTMFNLNPTVHNIHKNTLQSLRKQYGKPNLYNEHAPIGFIGQGAIGDKYQKSVQQYLVELQTLAESANRKIIYFPHRTERNEVREKLEKEEHIIYHRSEYPLEIELIDKKIELSGFIGTYSTVMFTARLLYPELPIYTISNDFPDKELKEELDRQFKAINVKKINSFNDL